MGNVEIECNPCSVALFYNNIYMSMNNLLYNLMSGQGLIHLETLMLSMKIEN